MTDLSALQAETLAAIAGAADEAALEAVRVAALGKKGAISEPAAFAAIVEQAKGSLPKAA